MTLDPGAQATIVGVGVAAIIANCAAIFKVATLRGDVNQKWSGRVAYAVAALDEKTLAELDGLRDDIDAALPAFVTDPLQAIADPGPLSRRAERAAKLYRTRARMESNLRLLCNLGPVLLWVLAALLVSIVGVTLHHADLVQAGWVRLISWLVLATCSVALAVGMAGYALLQHRLAGAELLAGSAGSGERLGGEDA